MSDPLSIAANVITLLQLTAVTIEYLKGIKNGAADRLHLRDELRSTACLLEMLRDRIEDAEDADLRSESTEKVLMKSLVGSDSPLILFQRMLEEIIAKLSPQDKLRQRSLPLMWPFTKKDIAEKLSSIERLKSHISLAMQSDLVELAQSSHHKIINLGQKMDRTDARFQDDETQKIILWLSPLFFREQHVAILESVQPDTGVWFVQHDSFRSWVHGDTNLLWCPGLPGAGKTRLMSIAVDLLEHHEKIPINSLCTYIYCNYERQKEQTSAALLSSILQQILQHSTSDTMPLEVLSLYNSHKKYGTRPTLTQLSDLLIKLASAFETLFVVIDALDECAVSEEEALQLLSIIRSIGPQVKILCSSRFSTTFEAYFASTEKLEIYAQTKDIRLFLDSGIGLQSRLSKHVRADPSLKAHIIDSITEECKGMFLLAKLHLESLSTKINRKAVRSSLRTLPASLDDTYSEALRRIYDQSSDAVALAETVLFWVICASQPLTVIQLQHMYATKELTDDMPLEIDDLPDADILTAACGGLVTVDNESQTIHAIHYTVQQYFERSFSQKLVAAKMSVTKVSLAYLTLPNFSSGFCTTDADMLDRLTQYPFLEYAAKNWGSSAGCLEVDELLAYLRRFCSSPAAIEMTSQVWSLPDARFNNWSQEFPRKSPALVLAAAFELPVILRQMIEDGHEIEGKGTDQETALMRASALGHTNNVRVLLRLGAVANARDYMGESSLQKAALNGHECVVRSLLEGGADATNKASSDWTPLMSAVCSGNIDIVR
ncbi:serine/threonine-protein kinase chk2 (cds1) [Penicillium canescens]|nr:serine/threonine-protein kinase chk2 (cds1) [Penicillium canescens]